MADYCFICYAHQNSRFARRLARHLQRAGLPVWFDQWQDTEDESWERTLTEAVLGCASMVLILSPAALDSWVVREQSRLARETGKSIVTARYQPCQPPALLAQTPVIDFTAGRFETGLAQLLLRLGVDPDPATLKAPLWERLASGLRRRAALLWLGLGLLFVLGAGLGWGPLAEWLAWPELPTGREPVVVVYPTVNRTPAALSVANPYPTPLRTNVRMRDGKVMVRVPAGEFLLGSLESNPAASEDETPQRLIHLDAFWIDKMEITNGQYQRCVEAGACTPSSFQQKWFRGDTYPVVGVDWSQANGYCRWVGGRLPTEAEWEKAARGADGRRYPWGNTFGASRLNYCDTNCVADWRDQRGDDGYRYTAPVGSYPTGASPYGVLDLSGNVWEWTADWYAPDAYARAPDRNPTGPEQGQQRVIRGGSWYYYGKSLRAANRHKDIPSSSYDNIGFRCVVVDS